MAKRLEQRNGRWLAGYTGPDRKWRYKTYDRKVDAEMWLRDQLVAVDRGEWIDPRARNTTVVEFAAEWYEATGHLKPSTREGYESALRIYVIPKFGNWRISDVNRASVRKWLSRLQAAGLSASRTRQVRGVLSQVVEFAVESGALRANPTRRLKVPGDSSREMLFLNAGQVHQLADAAETIQEGAGTLVYLLAYSGLRWGEAVALRRGRCDILRGKLDIREAVSEVKGELYFGSPKTHQSRTVVLPKPVRDLLAAHMSAGRSNDVDALVFTDSARGPLRNSNWRHRVWKPACEAAGMPDGLRIHDLRHTAASLMVSTGANVKAVQRQLGHAKASMTLDRYSHLFTDDLEAMADRLEAVFNEGYEYSASTGPSDDLVELAG